MSESGTYIMAFDPGDTTGWVYVYVDFNNIKGYGIFDHKDFVKFDDKCDEFMPYSNIIIIERFLVRPGAGPSAWTDEPALQVIGRIKAKAAHFGVEVIFQEPAQAKRMNNEVLKDAGFNLEDIKNQHVRDALRHALVWMRKNDSELHQLLAWKEARRCAKK